MNPRNIILHHLENFSELLTLNNFQTFKSLF